MAFNASNLEDGLEKERYYKPEPPGFISDIMRDIDNFELRPQPGMRVVAALQMISAIVGNRIRSPGGLKLNLITLVTGVTGGGKGAGMSYAKKAIAKANLDVQIYGKPASRQDMEKNIVTNGGNSFYFMDEAHALLEAVSNPKSPAYLRDIEAFIMDTYTGESYSFSGNFRRDAEQQLADARKRATKAATEFGMRPDEKDDYPAGSAPFEILQAAKERMEAAINGVRNPFIGMYMTTTPAKIESIFSAEKATSGFLGRLLVIRGPDLHPRKKPRADRAVMPDVNANVINVLRSIRAKTIKRMEYDSEETERLSEELEFRFEDELNGDLIADILSRQWESVEKIATIIALCNSTKITKEILLWSYFFVLDSVMNIFIFLNSNASEEESGASGLWNELIAKTHGVLSQNKDIESSIYQGALIQRIFRSGQPKMLASNYAKCLPSGNLKDAQLAIFTEIANALVSSKAIEFAGMKVWSVNQSAFYDAQPTNGFNNIWNAIGNNVSIGGRMRSY